MGNHINVFKYFQGRVTLPRLAYSMYMTPNVCVFEGLPVQVRDAALKIADEMPRSDVNKEYYTQNMEREVCS